MDLQLLIEGEAAGEAATELLSISGWEGNWTTPEDNHRDVTLAAIATIIGIASGAASAADHLYQWYQDWRKGKNGKRIEKVILRGKKGKRIVLENATLGELRALLEE